MDDDSYPYLYEISREQKYPLPENQTLTAGGGDACDIALDDCQAGEAFRIQRVSEEWQIIPRSDKVTVSVDQVAIDGAVGLQHLSVVQANHTVFVFVEHEDPLTATSYSANVWLITKLLDQPEAQAANPGQTIDVNATVRLPRKAPVKDVKVPLELPGRIELPEKKRMVIGRDKRADICLSDVRVSRLHAWIERHGETATIVDLKSANETFVDGQPIRKPTVLSTGARIQIGPHTLIFRGHVLYPLSLDKNVELIARNLVRRVPDRNNRGALKVILDDISLVIRPREFACILGPSGSGKTTLLSCLSGRVPADEGSVSLNGENLYADFDALKQNLAVVPQRDVLHDVLPLSTALWYTAKMRLPADIPNSEVEERIDESLDTVNLVQRQYTRIQQLSGGQIKRASWANETISNPSLIFLDEVTSGLDEQSDAEMMHLFRRMAEEGKTIVCITHNLGNVENNCHLVVILTEGGSLAFVGPPAAALEYFDIPRLGDVYHRLREESAHTWRDRFRQSDYFKTYVARRLPRAETGFTPIVKRRRRPLFALWRQFHLQLRRYLAIQWADKRALSMVFGQCVVIATLLVWLFGDISKLDVEKTVQQREEQLYELQFGEPLADLTDEDRKFLEEDEEYVRRRNTRREELASEAELEKRTDLSSKLLFLLCISCIWFGCNNAAKEIVKERTIYEKERDAGLRIVSYFGSKLVLLGCLSVLQASLFFWIVNHFTNLGGDALQQGLLLSLSSLTGVTLGLAISALATTEDFAATIVPLALIPQIILAGLIAPLSVYARGFSQVCIPAYWSFQGLLTSLEDPLPERLHSAGYLNLSLEWTPLWAGLILLIYVFAFAATALLAMYRQD